MTGQRAAVVIEPEHASDAAKAHVSCNRDGELELLGGIEQCFETLHEGVIDGFVVAHEEVGELERGALAIGEQRTVGKIADCLVELFGDRLLRRRRRTPLESNRAAVEPGHHEAHELTLTQRQPALLVDRVGQVAGGITERGGELPKARSLCSGPVGKRSSCHHASDRTDSPR